MGAAIFKFLIVYLTGFDWHAWVCFVFFFQKRWTSKRNKKYVDFQMDVETLFEWGLSNVLEIKPKRPDWDDLVVLQLEASCVEKEQRGD